MRKLAAVLAVSAISLIASAQAYADTWHDLSQTNRDHYIMQEAGSHQGQWGGQCWVYASNSIKKAAAAVAGTSVEPDLIQPSNIDYTTDIGAGTLNPHLVKVGLNKPLSDADVHVGMLVQMLHRQYGKHSAIIGKIDRVAMTVTWYESNYCGIMGLSKNCEIVNTTRTENLSTFYSNMQEWSVYYVK